MNYNELYVLNTAIDGKDMYAVQNFSDKPMIRVTAEMIKDILVEKGLLTDYKTFTDKGLAEVRKIKQYKEAKKYITILNMIIGYINDKQGILLTIGRNGDFLFSVIDIGKILNTIMKAFPDLLESKDLIQANSSNKFYVNSRDIMNVYKINAKTSFTIKTEINILNERSTREFFFESEGIKYCYDCNNSKLYEKQSHELVELLRERLEVI